MSAARATTSFETEAGHHIDFVQPFRTMLLNEFARSRDAINRAFRADSSADPSLANRVTDELLGISLLMRFVQQHKPESIPDLERFFDAESDKTVRKIANDIHRSLDCQVLRAVFHPAEWDASLALPRGLHRHLFGSRVPTGAAIPHHIR